MIRRFRIFLSGFPDLVSSFFFAAVLTAVLRPAGARVCAGKRQEWQCNAGNARKN